ncbi:TetR/AcrR family transcriptional regulator, partial [Sesbania bispinosa]
MGKQSWRSPEPITGESNISPPRCHRFRPKKKDVIVDVVVRQLIVRRHGCCWVEGKKGGGYGTRRDHVRMMTCGEE